MTGSIELHHDGQIAWIVIDNQSRRNAMSLKMWGDLGGALQNVGNDVRCIVIRGAGDKAFVSGADISEFADQRRSPHDVAAYDRQAEDAMARLYAAPQPTIAMISGYCFGGGVALSLCCDIRLASENSQFAVPAARLGLGYGVQGFKKLLDVVGAPVAMDILFSARRFSANEALAVGLLNKIHPQDALVAEVTRYAETIAQNAPLTIRAAKLAIRELTKSSAPDLDLCNRLAAECFASDDYLEGARAFMEKRDPRFTGR